jgi:hypothetical protein
VRFAAFRRTVNADLSFRFEALERCHHSLPPGGSFSLVGRILNNGSVDNAKLWCTANVRFVSTFVPLVPPTSTSLCAVTLRLAVLETALFLLLTVAPICRSPLAYVKGT